MKTKKNIWILEDHKGEQFVFSKALEYKYVIHFFSSIASFEEMLKKIDLQEPPDFIIADLQLEDGSVLDFMGSPLWEVSNKIPFMVISSMSDVEALRWCFNHGVKDYLVKPFKKEELIVKLERFVEKNNSQAKVKSFLPGVKLDSSQFKIKNGTLLSDSLTQKEYQILRIIMNSQENGATREEIISGVWGQIKVSAKCLDVHLVNLRKKTDLVKLEIIFDAQSNCYRLNSK